MKLYLQRLLCSPRPLCLVVLIVSNRQQSLVKFGRGDIETKFNMSKTDSPNYDTFSKSSEAGVMEMSSSDSSVSFQDQGKQNVTTSSESQMTREKMMNTFIICLCNLLNFMDRYALPGKLFRLFVFLNNIIIYYFVIKGFYP